MKARAIGIAAAIVVAAAAGAFALKPSKPPASAPSSASTQAAEAADEVRQDPAPAAQAVQAPPDTAVVVATAAPALTAPPAPVDPAVADERTVLGMYQNMADAVDAYGPDACPALGQAFGTFVSDAAGATSRLVQASKAKGQDFTATFTAAHAAEVDRVKTKLQEAIKRCGTDPGLRTALTSLAKSG